MKELAMEWSSKALRKFHFLVERTIGFRKRRWALLTLISAYVLYRVIQFDYLGLMYFLGLYIIYLIVQFYTPSGLPDPDEDSFESSLFVEESKLILQGGEGDRPVLRSITEFNLWKNVSITVVGCWLCTHFEIFLIPVYWPFLLIYFIWLIGLAVNKHYRHMQKYGYSFGDFTRKRNPVTI